MRPIGCELDEKIALYLISAMKRGFAGFAWGQSSFNVNVLKDVMMMLPVTNSGEPDFEYMSAYIRAQQKLAIADVVRLKDRIIAETKHVVAR